MKRLLLLGSSLGTIQIIKYAKNQGIYVIVTDNFSPEKSPAKKYADEYWMIDTSDLDSLERKCRSEGIDAVLCGVSDFNTEMAIKLCNRLDLPIYCDEKTWKYSIDKRAFKQLCYKCEVPVAKDYYITNNMTCLDELCIDYPVVVKPNDLSGNKGVSYCYNEAQLVKAYEYAMSLSTNPEIIIEKMLEGDEWWAYYAIAEGEVRFLGLNAMYAKPGELKNIYSITTTVTNHTKHFVAEINSKIETLLKEVGCKDGVAWVQVMLDKDGHFYVIEMGHRLTGECIFVPFTDVSSFDSVKWLIDFSLGKKHTKYDLPERVEKSYTKCACAYMLWTNSAGTVKEILGFDKLESVPGVTIDLLCYVGRKYEKYNTMGTVLISADDCIKLCDKLKFINENIHIFDENNVEMIIKYKEYDFLLEKYKESLVE